MTIISHLAWERMGKPADAIGRTIKINQRAFTIVGIAPEGFGGTITMVTPELWVPTGVYESLINDFADNRATSNLADRRHHTLILFGRLREG
ncbi:MAG: ABC transporter permease [Acidobacteria bacterium]|nr:ABC transporter permease [Acidobacteriota bacterium]